MSDKLVRESQVIALTDVTIEAINALSTEVKSVASGIQGTIKPDSAAPTMQGMYVCESIGIYTHFGNIEISETDFTSGISYIVFSLPNIFKKYIVLISANGEVKEGELRAVSGSEVFDKIKDIQEINSFSIDDLSQGRLSQGRSVIYNGKINRNVRYLNIYSPQDGIIKVFKATRENNTFLVKDVIEIITNNNKFSYYIDMILGEGEFIGVNFVEYGYVIQNGVKGTFLTLPNNISVTSSYDFLNLNEFVKISFSFHPNNQELIVSNKNKTDLNLDNNPIINGFSSNIIDKRKPNKSVFIIDKKYSRNTVINYVRIHKPMNGIVLILNLKKNTDNTFTVINYFRLATSTKTDLYKISIQINEGGYLGAYFSNYGYVVDSSTDTGEYDSVYEYVGDPTIGSFSATKTTSKVKVSFKADYSVTDKLDSLSKFIPVTDSKLSIIDTSEKKVKTGQPLYLKDPYGYNQFLHPNVRYFPDGWNRYKYWMCVTPMPIGGEFYPDRYENPCVYVSNDAITWHIIQGSTNPIDELTQSNIDNKDYMSDPCFVYREDLNRMECWYRITFTQENNKTLILRKHTTDGINWSSREVMIDTTVLHMVRSQFMMWDNKNKKYRMWYTGGNSGISVSYNESTDGFVWNSYTPCTGINQCWHLDVCFYNNKYYLLNYELNASTGVNQLKIHESVDGINYNQGSVILKPEIGTWFSKGLYKSALIHNGTEFIMYFTGEASDSRFIGIATGSDPYKLVIRNGKYEVGRVIQGGAIEFANTNVQNSLFMLGDGNSIGYDTELKMLYVKKTTGEIFPFLKI